MCKVIGAKDVEDLMNSAIPDGLPRLESLEMGVYTKGMSESEFLEHFKCAPCISSCSQCSSSITYRVTPQGTLSFCMSQPPAMARRLLNPPTCASFVTSAHPDAKCYQLCPSACIHRYVVTGHNRIDLTSLHPGLESIRAATVCPSRVLCNFHKSIPSRRHRDRQSPRH